MKKQSNDHKAKAQWDLKKLKRKRSAEKTKIVNKRQKTSENEKSLCERRSISLRNGKKTGQIPLTTKNKNLRSRKCKNLVLKSK